jgi:hypothetical protein
LAQAEQVKLHIARLAMPISKLCLLLLAGGAFVAGALPAHASSDWWLVVTVARNGAWGVPTDPVQFQAIVGAIRACRERSPVAADCGALLKVNRGGWIVGSRCGHLSILASGATILDAEEAESHHEAALRADHLPALPGCVRLITVDPRGAVVDESLAMSGGE